MNKRFVFFILLHFILFGLFLNPEIGFTQEQDPVDPNVIYLELIEENVDDFDFTLFRIRRKPEVMPFLFRNHSLQIDDEILEYSEGGISLLQDLSNCHIHGIDMNGITVYLKHIIRFKGNGRKYDFNEYYIFNQFPQAISLPLSEAPATFYTLETSMTKVLEIRLSHGDIGITGVSDKEDVTVEYNGDIPLDYPLTSPIALMTLNALQYLIYLTDIFYIFYFYLNLYFNDISIYFLILTG